MRAGAPLGFIEMPGAFARARMVVRAPADGTVVIADATEGTYVSTGTTPAVATDLTRVRVTALVDETVADEVHVGPVLGASVDLVARLGPPWRSFWVELPVTADSY